MKTSFLWLKDFVAIKDNPAVLANRLTLSGIEVESVDKAGKDQVLELAVPPNRGDLLGHEGIGREVAAILKQSFHPLKTVAPKGVGKIRSKLTVQVKDRDRSRRYIVRMISGIKVGTSPAWLKERLDNLGLRSINNVVDVTNLVMLELGQPLHAFDYDKIREHSLIIQPPASPMRIRALDGVEYSLGKEDLCIMDAGGPVAIAGVMGGQNSSVSDNTHTIVLESAYFWPSAIRKTSRRLGLSTDSSRRFERSVDPESVDRALHRATQLIVDLAGGTPSADWIDFYPRKIVPARVTLTAEMVTQTLGTELKPPQIVKYLNSLGCVLRSKGTAKWQVIMPPWRQDLARPIDLIEEIIRLHGYDHIPETLPAMPTQPTTEPAHAAAVRQIRTTLVGAGLDEALHYGFELKSDIAWSRLTGAIPIRNPLGNDETLLRPELAPALINAVARNIRHRSLQGGLFEVRHAFVRGSRGEIQEPLRVAMVLFGEQTPLSWTGNKSNTDFFDIKGVVERLLSSLRIPAAKFQAGGAPGYSHPKESATIQLGNTPLGWLGRIHPELAERLEITVPCYVAELDVAPLMAASHKAHMQALPRFPEVRRDVALLVDDKVTADDLFGGIRKAGGKLLKAVTLFDHYKGKNIPQGKKSVAYALVYQDSERTLTDEIVNAAHRQIVEAITKQFGATIR